MGTYISNLLHRYRWNSIQCVPVVLSECFFPLQHYHCLFITILWCLLPLTQLKNVMPVIVLGLAFMNLKHGHNVSFVL